MSQYFVNMNTEVSKEYKDLANLRHHHMFETPSDKKYQIELTTDEYDVHRSNVISIKLGVANTTNYVFLIEREDTSYGTGSGKKLKVACKDIDVKFDDEEKKIYIAHRDKDEKIRYILAAYSIPRQSFGPHAYRNQKEEFVQFLKTCAFQTKRPCLEDSTFINYEAKMPPHEPEPEPPSTFENYDLAIVHMHETWKEITQLRKQLNQKCKDVNNICERIEDKSLEIDFWHDCASL